MNEEVMRYQSLYQDSWDFNLKAIGSYKGCKPGQSCGQSCSIDVSVENREEHLTDDCFSPGEILRHVTY